jgi:hypothetical protein
MTWSIKAVRLTAQHTLCPLPGAVVCLSAVCLSVCLSAAAIPHASSSPCAPSAACSTIYNCRRSDLPACFPVLCAGGALTVKDGVSFPPALANQPHPSGVRAPHPSSPYAALSRTLDDNCSSTPRDARQPVHLARLLSRLRLRCLCPAPRRLQKLRPAPARHPRRPRRRRPPPQPPRRASPAPLPTAPRCTPPHTTLAPLVRPVRHELPPPYHELRSDLVGLGDVVARQAPDQPGLPRVQRRRYVTTQPDASPAKLLLTPPQPLPPRTMPTPSRSSRS